MALKKLHRIKNDIQRDPTMDYGYYGRQAVGLKRMLFWGRLQTALALYEKYCNPKQVRSILDFGCQFAFVSAALASHVKIIYLTEIAQPLLDLGIGIHKKYGNQNYIPLINPEHKPAEYVKYIQSGEKIDLFLMFDVLEHVRPIDELMKSIRMVSSDEAKLLISLPTENFFYMLLNRFKREAGHCHRYYDVESSLKKMQYRMIKKKSLWGLFNIYLYEI
ncbi:class I SAM-dependent methyltransferase [bacterium]|nr:class I SAM-dependent methyltransferase [bacterium]